MDDSNLNLEPIDGVNSHEGRRGNHLPQWLAILIVLLALVTLVLMIMLISAAQDNARSAATNTGTAAEVTSTETTETKSAPIIVVWVEKWLSENGALTGRTSGRSTTTQVSTNLEPEPVEPDEPAAPAEPAEEPAAELVLTGVDEDVAAARARSAGLKPYSVYGFPAIAASSGISLPPAGQVFRWEPFNGRVEGEKFAFLYVQTTEPRSAAVTVPSVQGKTWRNAMSTLAAAGLNVRFEYEHESPSTYGTAVFQAPSSGSLMPRGCSVVVVLAD